MKTFEKISRIEAGAPTLWKDKLFLTFDVDWAPDYIIEFLIDLLVERQVKATWFITHETETLGELRRHNDLFEIGIHPNFRNGSSHGNNEMAVLKTCMCLVPEATTMRTHGLVQSSNIFRTVTSETLIQTDVSLFMPYQTGLSPFCRYYGGKPLLHVPTIWFDDYEFEKPVSDWVIDRSLIDHHGIKVFGFHPTHIYLNSASRAARHAISRAHPDLQSAPRSLVDSYRAEGAGVSSAFITFLDAVQDKHI